MSDNIRSNGVGGLELLTIVFITLKLTKVITWSWWWVLSPIWIPILAVIFVPILLLIAKLILR